jgi:FMN phosphatase YigB (HAD superfamily)
MRKTLVTLDFDGVVSPIDHDRDFTLEAGWTQFNFGMMCDIHETVLTFLQELHQRDQRGEIDLVWASSWNDSTQIFGFKSDGAVPTLPHLDLGGATTKDEAILAKVEEGDYDRLLILEDSTRVMRRLRRLIKSKESLDALLIMPDVKIGLRPNHIRKALNFLDMGHNRPEATAP